MKMLEQCPFCGSGHVTISGDRNGWFRIKCNECGASGPSASKYDHAAVLWNERIEYQEKQA